MRCSSSLSPELGSTAAEIAMTPLDHDISPQYGEDWPELIGKLILNFSVIELASIRWIVHLTKDSSNIAVLAKSRFRERMSRVTAALARPRPPPPTTPTSSSPSGKSRATICMAVSGSS